MSRKIEIPNFDDLLERYLAGEPEQKLSREIGVNRQTFRRHLLERNITPRGVSESMFIRWENATPAERSALLDKAHASTRGRSIPVSEQIAQAIGREKSQSGVVPAETMLANWLRESDLAVTQQKAIHIYNLDIAIDTPPIAVEIYGGRWHAYGKHITRFFERTKYLLDNGWAVIIVWVDGRRYPLSIASAEYIIAFTQELSSDPALPSQYRVIHGDGNLAPAIKSQLNTPSIIKRLSATD